MPLSVPVDCGWLLRTAKRHQIGRARLKGSPVEGIVVAGPVADVLARVVELDGRVVELPEQLIIDAWVEP